MIVIKSGKEKEKKKGEETIQIMKKRQRIQEGTERKKDIRKRKERRESDEEGEKIEEDIEIEKERRLKRKETEGKRKRIVPIKKEETKKRQ